MKADEYTLYASRLGELSPGQLKDLSFRLSRLNPKDQVNLSEDWLLAGIIEALKEQGLIRPALGFAFKSSAGYAAYRKAAGALMLWLEGIIPAGHKAASWRLKISREAGLALIAYGRIKYWPIVPNAGLILKLAGEIPDALDQAFPGYIEAGLGHLIIDPKGGLERS
jgi:hypothetical protein